MILEMPHFIQLLPEDWKAVAEYQTSHQRLDLDTWDMSSDQ
jgi:hypothetical protein